MLGDLGRNLVTFQHVLQRLHAEAKTLGDAQEHEDLVGSIAMAVDLEIPLEDVG